MGTPFGFKSFKAFDDGIRAGELRDDVHLIGRTVIFPTDPGYGRARRDGMVHSGNARDRRRARRAKAKS